MFLKVPLDFGHIHPLQLGNGMGFKYPWGLGVWVFKGMGGGTEYQTRGTPGGYLPHSTALSKLYHSYIQSVIPQPQLPTGLPQTMLAMIVRLCHSYYYKVFQSSPMCPQVKPQHPIPLSSLFTPTSTNTTLLILEQLSMPTQNSIKSRT
jgi:hypothetical protein